MAVILISGRSLSSQDPQIYFELRRRLADKSVLVCFDLSLRTLLWPRFWLTPRDHRVLFTLEPPAVLEYQYSPLVRLLFRKVYRRGIDWGKDTWPAGVETEGLLTNDTFQSERKNAVGMVVANKNSFHRESKYAYRIRLLSQIGQLDGVVAELAGRGWEISRSQQLLQTWKAFLLGLAHPLKMSFRSALPSPAKLVKESEVILRGPVSSSRNFLEEFRYSLVVENQSSLYVSEKLLDALSAKTIIAYEGGALPKFLTDAYPMILVGKEDAPEIIMEQMSKLHPPSKSAIQAANQYIESRKRIRQIDSLEQAATCARKGKCQRCRDIQS